MRPTKLSALALPALLAIACGDETGTHVLSVESLSRESEEVAMPPARPRGEHAPERVAADVAIIDERTPPGTELNCPRASSTGSILVEFGCEDVTVHTCKDVSNVVLELEDGSHYKIEGLKGHLTTFVAPDAQAILRVWVKAGSNHSGEGPGYGERFDAPEDSCAPIGDSPPPGVEEETVPATPDYEVVV